mgnify:CR=1 FL=1
MWAKLIREEKGQYIDRFSGKKVNMLIAENFVATPSQDINYWYEFQSEEEAMKFFGLVKENDVPERTTDIPEHILLQLSISSYNLIERTVYWCGDISATDEYFRIDLLVKHQNHPELDKWIYTYVDRKTTIQHPQTGELVNEYEFFLTLADMMPLLEVIKQGIQKADIDGTINRRLYNE